jgi:hypothetical protein
VGSSLTGPFIRKVGAKDAELRRAWKGIDPLDYERANAGKPALLINARGDTVIPYVNAVRLKDAFPAARQVWVPFGHYTAILHLFWVPRYVSQRFQAALAPVKKG